MVFERVEAAEWDIDHKSFQCRCDPEEEFLHPKRSGLVVDAAAVERGEVEGGY